MPRAVPLVEVRAPAVQHRAQEPQRNDARVGPHAQRCHRDLEPARHRQLRPLVDRLQVFPEQAVERRLVGGVVVVAEPPEPVGALGRVQRLPGGRVALGSGVGRHQGLARAGHQVPRAVLFRMPDPDPEVGIDPRSAVQTPERLGRAARREHLRRGAGANVRRRLQRRMQRLLERAAVVGIVLPAVLAIQDHRHDLSLVSPAIAGDLAHATHEVGDGVRGLPVVIDEPDAVR